MGFDTTAILRAPRPLSTGLKQLAGWVALCLLLIGIFSAWLFPYDRLQAWALHHWHQRTGLRLTTDSWRFNWPLGFIAQSATLTGPGVPRLEATRLSLQLSPSGLLQGAPTITGTAGLRQAGSEPGAFSGRLTLGGWSWSHSASLTATLDRLDLSQFGWPSVSGGTVRITADHRWDQADNSQAFIQGTGTWQFDGAGLTLRHVPLGAVALPQIRIDSMQAKLRCREGTCLVEEARGKGPDGSFVGAGVLAMRLPPADSVFDGEFTLSLAQPTPLSMRLKVAGPLSQLRVTF